MIATATSAPFLATLHQTKALNRLLSIATVSGGFVALPDIDRLNSLLRRVYERWLGVETDSERPGDGLVTRAFLRLHMSGKRDDKHGAAAKPEPGHEAEGSQATSPNGR